MRETGVRSTSLLILLLAGSLVALPESTRQNVSTGGVVTRAKTGDTVSGARITLFSPDGSSLSATSDNKGRFNFNSLRPGRYRILIQTAGFVSYDGILDANPPAQSFQFDLVPTSVLFGKVTTDETGAPRVGMSVAAIRAEFEDGRRMLSYCTAPAQTKTDDRGNYRLFGLEPGQYYLVFYPFTCDAAPQFYPGTTNLANAVRVDVEGGAMVMLDARLPQEKTYSVLFKAADSALAYNKSEFASFARIVMNSEPDLHVRIMDLSFLSQSFGKEADGRYRISGLPPGNYTIYYGADILFANFARLEVAIVDRDIDLGTIVPSDRTSGLTGTISSKLSSESLSNLRVRLHASDGPFPASHFRANPWARVIAATGVFTFPNLAGQRYFIEVAGLPEDAYLASARYGAQDVLSSGISLNGPPGGPLDLEVRPKGGSVEGTVHDSKGNPLQQGVVALIPIGSPRTNPLLFRTDTIHLDGSYSIRGVLPGEYDLLAWEHVDQGAWLNEKFLQSFTTRATRVTVREGLQNPRELRGIQ